MTLNGSHPNVKQRRQRIVLDLISHSPIGSQEELVELLHERGFEVTQATVSRDAAESGLVKVPRGDRHVYATPETAATGNAYDARLQRLLEDIPAGIGRRDRPGDRSVEPDGPGRNPRRGQHPAGHVRDRSRPRAVAGPLPDVPT